MQRPMAFPPHPRRWWKTPPFVVLGLLTALACSVVSAEGRYAFLVGVENYDPTELPSLTYAEDDIEAIGQALEKLGFNIVSMTSNASLPARKPVLSSDIVDQLETFLALRNRDDTVFCAAGRILPSSRLFSFVFLASRGSWASSVAHLRGGATLWGFS